MDVSKFLSKVTGVYLIIVSVAMLTNMNQFIHYISELINDAPLMFVTGFFTLIIGILMVVSHNIWRWNWRTLVTIVAWMVFLKGITIILYPQFIDKMTTQFIENMNIAYIAAGFDLVLGLLLAYLGCRR